MEDSLVNVLLDTLVNDVKIVSDSILNCSICNKFCTRRLFTKCNLIVLGDVCTPNPCLNGGVCVSNGYGGFTCQCRPGFSGQRCEDQDGCASQPCQNRGVCVSSGGGAYVCQCRTGFEGINCEQRELNQIFRLKIYLFFCYSRYLWSKKSMYLWYMSN